MNLFNRLVVTLLALALVLAGLFIFLVAGGALAPAAIAPYPPLAGAVSWLRTFDGIPALPAGGAAAAVLGLIVLTLELRTPGRPGELLLQQDGLGLVTVSLNGLRRLAEHVVHDVPGVDAVVSDARPAHDGLHFSCRVVVRPEASTPELADEIRKRLGAAVAHHLGQPAARIHIHARVGALEPVRQKGRRVR